MGTRSASEVSISIIEARTEVISGDRDSVRGRAVSKLMQKASFTGRNALSWERSAGIGWILTARLTLTLVLPLPPFVPLPPGFNTIGSAIVQTTCRERATQNLLDVRDAYTTWPCGPKG